jgi:N4-gp56 family major capsid protein
MNTLGATNFAKMTDEDYTKWSMSFWKWQREYAFHTKFLGTGPNAMIQRITEFTESQKGARAVITLIHDALGDGVAGDRTLEGNEEQLRSDDEVVRVDQLRHAHALEGRVADQKSIVNFRKEARDTLSYWMADRIDQLIMLHLCGVDSSLKLDGTPRVGSDFPFLEFNQDIAPPSANRHFRWDVVDGKGSLVATPSTADVAPEDVPTYDLLIEAKALAQDLMMKPVRGTGLGTELFHVFMHSQALKHLKLDPKFHAAVKDAMPRSPNNPLFKGSEAIYVDNMLISPTRYSFHPSTWGAGGDVRGNRIVICGAQALGYAEIGRPYWVEEEKDYKNRPAISIGKMFGVKKPKFLNDYTGTEEDFSVMAIDVAIP